MVRFKKFICIFAGIQFLILTSGCATLKTNVSPSFNANNIKRVAVSTFKGPNGEILSDMFATELMRLNIFDIVERSQVDSVLVELSVKDQIRRVIDDVLANIALLKELAGILNVDAILVGSSIIMYDSMVINTRLVDVKAGTVLWSTSYTIDYQGLGYMSAANLEGAVRETVNKLKNTILRLPKRENNLSIPLDKDKGESI